MGTLGWQETVFIFLLALLLFGPKKLPALGRTLGKAMTEFRRASSELKATFDREMKSLEQETESLKQVANQYQYDTYNYDYSSYRIRLRRHHTGRNRTIRLPPTHPLQAHPHLRALNHPPLCRKARLPMARKRLVAYQEHETDRRGRPRDPQSSAASGKPRVRPPRRPNTTRRTETNGIHDDPQGAGAPLPGSAPAPRPCHRQVNEAAACSGAGDLRVRRVRHPPAATAMTKRRACCACRSSNTWRSCARALSGR